MYLFKKTSNIDFLKFRFITIIISLVIITAGVVGFFTKGLNLGIDFRGGVNIQIQFSEEVDISQIRDLARIKLGKEAVVTYFGNKNNNEFLMSTSQKERQQDINDIINETFQEDYTFEVRKIELVGPKIGSELRKKALYAILWALVGILIYITIRFEFLFGIGAILALFHDILIIITVFILLGKEFNLIIIASLLTIVGYSLNDTIVIYDRIREKKKEVNRLFRELINLGVNECLSRTILTSTTTLLVALTLFFFGGEIINDFAFSIIIGVITGTYSSVFIAASSIFYFYKENKTQKEE